LTLPFFVVSDRYLASIRHAVTCDKCMTALGHKRPFSHILAQRLLPGVKRSFELNEFVEIRGPFPECLLFPKADVQITKY